MKIKSIVLSVLSLCAINSTFAQQYSSSNVNLGECGIKNGVRYCNVVPRGTGVVTHNPTPMAPINTQVELPPEIDPAKTMEELNKVQPPKGSYNSKVPGGNVFVFCSGNRPSRANPLRPIYDSICPASKGNIAPGVPAPPGIPTPPTILIPKPSEDISKVAPVSVSNGKVRVETNPVYNTFK